MRPQNPDLDYNFTDYLYVLTVVFVLLALLFLFFLVVSLKRRRKMNLEKIQLQTQFQQELLRTQLEIQEQTFKIISQELHDNVGQMLTLAKLNLNMVDLQTAQQDAEKIGNAKDLVGRAIQDIRDLSKTLNTDTIAAAGLLNAIEAELLLLQKTGTLQTAFHRSGATTHLDPQIELILFRIVQEALHNVIKHAQATHVSVSAVLENHQLQLAITDNGRGFDAATRPVFGSGLRNMQSRSKLIGANWQIQNRKEGGTTVCIILPVPS